MSKKPVADLATVQYSQHDVISEIAFRVFYGTDAIARRDCALDALERYTDYFSDVEGTTVSISAYETKRVEAGEENNSNPYVLFTFGTFE